MNPPPIYFLRHGETEWNRVDRRQGQLGSDLTGRGIAQSRAMGRALYELIGPDIADWTLVSSPQDRAVHSARLADEALGLGFTTDDRLMEMGMGSWEGLTWPEIETRWSGIAGDHNTAHLRIPDGEGYAAMAMRAQSWLEFLRQPTIAVSHGIFARVLQTVYLGQGEEGYAATRSLGQDEFLLLAQGAIEVLALSRPMPR